MAKRNENEKYARRAFAGTYDPKFARQVKTFYRKCKTFKNPSTMVHFAKDEFEAHPELMALDSCLPSIRETIVDLVCRGASIFTLTGFLSPAIQGAYPADTNPLIEKFRNLGNDTLHLTGEWNRMVQEHERKRKAFVSRDRAIKSALRLLRDLPPISEEFENRYLKTSIDEFNRELQYTQTKMDYVIETYLRYTALGFLGEHWYEACSSGMDPVRLVKAKNDPTTQKSPLWNPKIVGLVDELIRIGFSYNQAYRKTAELLNIVYPDVYRDTDFNLVRQRYQYHIKKHPTQK